MIPHQSYPWIYFETAIETHDHASPPNFKINFANGN